MKKHFVAGFLCLYAMLLLCACQPVAQRTQKVRDLAYTVVKESEIPEAFLDKIEERKEEAFRLTYLDNDYLYIAKGYGKQDTGGYSITMKELFLAENAVYFATELHGPRKGETVVDGESYPFIVVKTEAIEKPVIFE